MPLTLKGKKILAKMEAEYGPQKGKEVFYASANSGKITGVHNSPPLSKADLKPKLFIGFPTTKWR